MNVVVALTKTCKRCDIEKSTDDFYPVYGEGRGKYEPLSTECKMCSSERRLINKYGISFEQYNEMLERQGGVCALCEREFDRLNVDHDHNTGRVRGLLCLSCNQALGKLGDNEVGLNRALSYVRDEFV